MTFGTLLLLVVGVGAVDEPACTWWDDGLTGPDDAARHDSAEHFSRLGALLVTATAWIPRTSYCFAIP